MTRRVFIVALGGAGHPGPNRSWYDTFKPEQIEGVCDRTKAGDGSGIIYPSGLRDYSYEVSTDELPITKEIMEARDVLYIEGCFAYKTFSVENKSGYCFMLVPKGSDAHKWQFRRCVYGNDIFPNN